MKSTSFKFAAGTIMVLGLLVVGAIWYLSYKPRVQVYIPSAADSIVCIDVVNLRNELIKNYFNGEDLGEANFFDIREIGLQIPDYIIGFTCWEQSPRTLFSSFTISNKEQYQNWEDSLINFKGYTKESKGKIIHVFSPSHTVIYSTLSDKKEVIISMGMDISTQNISAVCSSVFERTGLIKPEDNRIARIRENEHIGLIWIDKGKRVAKESYLGISFIENEIKLEGALFLQPDYQFPESSKINTGGNNAQTSISFNGRESLFLEELLTEINQDKFQKLAGFRLDSLQGFGFFKFNFSLYEPKTEIENVVTYEYDENFNKVERTEDIVKSFPSFDCWIGFNRPGAYSYLMRDSSIKIVNELPLFTGFPFATVMAMEENYNLFLYTSGVRQNQSVSFPCFLSFHADFTQMDSTYLAVLPFGKAIYNNRIVDLNGTQKGDSTFIDLLIK